MKKSLLLAILVFSFSLVFAQTELVVQTHEKGLFLNHTVVAKENFYSIGRLYNLPPKEIAEFNGLDMAAGLVIGQTLKIPLTSSNFSQNADQGRPVYYVVGPKEGLYRVSVNNNHVQMANLRKWNKLANDQIAAGQKLIVGYLVSPESGQIVVNQPEPPKQEPKQEVVQKQETPVSQEQDNKKQTAADQKTEQPSPRPAVSQMAVNKADGGYFKPHFEQQIKTTPVKKDETMSAGIFKTSSGWQDGKYYALIDGAEPGTIIKVTNPTNNKSIYAKVLSGMSGIRQNQGYDLRISNAAASALEVSDTDKFIVKVNY